VFKKRQSGWADWAQMLYGNSHDRKDLWTIKIVKEFGMIKIGPTFRGTDKS